MIIVLAIIAAIVGVAAIVYTIRIAPRRRRTSTALGREGDGRRGA